MIELSGKLLLTLKRQRGERNITVTKLSDEIGVSRWTLADILSDKKRVVQKTTIEKIESWISEQISN